MLVSGFGTPGEVVTTDRVGAAGYRSGNFTADFNGTSAAAPMVAGVVSLMYDANAGPRLARRPVDPRRLRPPRRLGGRRRAPPAPSATPGSWNNASTWNGGGQHYSNDYGYGLVDALAAVRLAESWLLTGSGRATSGNDVTRTMDVLNATVTVPDGNATGLSFSGSTASADIVERVTVQMTFSTTYTRDLRPLPDLAGRHGQPALATTRRLLRLRRHLDLRELRPSAASAPTETGRCGLVDAFGGDTLTVSDIVIRTFGAEHHSPTATSSPTSTRTTTASAAMRPTVSDSNGGNDTVNAAAVEHGLQHPARRHPRARSTALACASPTSRTPSAATAATLITGSGGREPALRHARQRHDRRRRRQRQPLRRRRQRHRWGAATATTASSGRPGQRHRRSAAPATTPPSAAPATTAWSAATATIRLPARAATTCSAAAPAPTSWSAVAASTASTSTSWIESVVGAGCDVLQAGGGGKAFDGPGGAAGDRIDLLDIDANITAGGDQAFLFGGTGKGYVWCVNAGNVTRVFANVDNDAAAEFLWLNILDLGVLADAYTATGLHPRAPPAWPLGRARARLTSSGAPFAARSSLFPNGAAGAARAEATRDRIAALTAAGQGRFAPRGAGLILRDGALRR